VINNFYLYRHIRLDSNTPFYIGIGSKKKNVKFKSDEYCRAFDKARRNRYWHRIVSKCNYDVEIIYECDDRSEIIRKEIEFIKLYGRISDGGILANLTDGGEGAFGSIRTKHHRIKMSNRMRGVKNMNYGKKFTETHRNKISLSNIGKRHTKDAISKMRDRIYKKIICMETGVVYNNAGVAARSLFNSDRRYLRVKVSECCRHICSFKGYTFRWLAE